MDALSCDIRRMVEIIAHLTDQGWYQSSPAKRPKSRSNETIRNPADSANAAR